MEYLVLNIFSELEACGDDFDLTMILTTYIFG